MSRNRTSRSLRRCCLIWVAVSVACAGVLALVADHLPRGFAPDPAHWDATPFDVLLASGCAIALAGCACWFWLVTSLVLVEAATGARPWQAGCPDGVRRALLALCGVALVAGTSQAPALAGTTAGLPPAPTDVDQRALAGLRLPERPSAEMQGPHRGTPQQTASSRARRIPADRHRIRPGDTLWDLAQQELPAHATDAEITRGWQRLWHANRDLIGPDPDLIHPGGVLRLPDQKEH